MAETRLDGQDISHEAGAKTRKGIYKKLKDEMEKILVEDELEFLRNSNEPISAIFNVQ